MTTDPAALRRARRQRRLALLRAAGLLPLAERLAMWREAARAKRLNGDFAEDAPMPPARWMHDMYAHADYAHYWSSGQAAAAEVARLIEGVIGPGPHRVAEWGCGMGRIVRHLVQKHEVTGFDYNDEAVAWCTEHLGGDYSGNGLMPPLPAEDGAFDAAYAVSVFTHLSEAAHEAWAAELARILRPGGALVITMHSAPEPGQLLPKEQAAFDAGQLVTRGQVKEGSRAYTAYQPEPYVRRLLDGFEILSVGSGLGQTAYVARRR